MFMHKSKKGFTIVELVIVIAVIAILAAVLIPTFSNLVKKANQSADIQAARQMNTALSTYVDGFDTIADVKIGLVKDGIDANNYKPLSKDHDFFWVPELNRIILVDPTGAVIFPEDIAQKSTSLKETWKSLGGIGNTEAVESLVKEVGSQAKVTLTGTTNFKGASLALKPTSDVTIGGTESAKATISDFVSDEGTKYAALTGVYADNTYNFGMIDIVPADTTVTVENLIIDGAVIGDTTTPDSCWAGIIAGKVAGNLIIKNVTIKNSTVFGAYRVGALVGAIEGSGTVTIEGNVTIEDTVVKGDTFVAALIGHVRDNSSFICNGTVTKKNVTVIASEYNDAKTDESMLITHNDEMYVYCEDGAQKWYAPGRTDKDYWFKYTDTNPAPQHNGIEIWESTAKNANN